MKTDTKDELRLANALLTEHIVNLQDRITSLESHNRELLAVNQVLREALQEILRLTSSGLSDCVYQVAQSVIDQHTADLIEVGKTVDYETPIANIVQGRINQGIKSGLTLYTIQTKSNTE